MKYLKTINELFSINNKSILDSYENLLLNNHDNHDLDDKFERIVTLLERNCKSFLEELKKSNNELVFRGVKSFGDNVSFRGLIEGFWINSSINRSGPLDTDYEISELFDEYFVEKFGIPLRKKGIFTTKNPIVASSYSYWEINSNKQGKAYMFFPVGDYKYFWNKNIVDLYTEIESKDWYENFYLNDIETAKQNIKSIVSNYQSGDLQKIDKQEITFICDNYYLLDDVYYFRMKEYLNR